MVSNEDSSVLFGEAESDSELAEANEQALRETIRSWRENIGDIENVTFTLHEFNTTTLAGGLPAAIGAFTFTVPQGQSLTASDNSNPEHDFTLAEEGTYTLTIVVAHRDGIQYTAVYSAPHPEYDRLLPTFERMLNSVVIG